MSSKVTVAALGIALAAGAVNAQAPASPVPLFISTCAEGNMGFDARVSAVTADNAWSTVSEPVQVKDFQRVPAISPVFGLEKPDTVQQWRRDWNGKDVRLVLARYPAKNRYRTLCALLIPGVENAMPFLGEFRSALKPLGLSGKSTDLPHYQEYSGTLKATGRKARADIFSRSGVGGRPKTMHLYIAS